MSKKSFFETLNKGPVMHPLLSRLMLKFQLARNTHKVPYDSYALSHAYPGDDLSQLACVITVFPLSICSVSPLPFPIAISCIMSYCVRIYFHLTRHLFAVAKCHYITSIGIYLHFCSWFRKACMHLPPIELQAVKLQKIIATNILVHN